MASSTCSLCGRQHHSNHPKTTRKWIPNIKQQNLQMQVQIISSRDFRNIIRKKFNLNWLWVKREDYSCNLSNSLFKKIKQACVIRHYKHILMHLLDKISIGTTPPEYNEQPKLDHLLKCQRQVQLGTPTASDRSNDSRNYTKVA